MRRPAVIAAAVAALAAGAGVAPAQDHAMHDAGATGAVPVSVGFDAFRPAHVDVLVGDTVRWTNDSVRPHTVSAEDGRFDSGRLPAGATYEQRFDAEETVPILCRLHVAMRGDIAAHTVLLTPPAGDATPRRAFPLAGRATLDADTPVTIEADEGNGFSAVATTTVQDDHTFATTVTPRTTASYRAVAAGHASPAVQLLVLDRTVRITPRRAGRSVAFSVQVSPTAPRATVVLQLRLRDRFGWWPIQQRRLDASSRGRFTIRLPRRVPARVVLTLPDGATELARSRTVVVGGR